MGPPTASRLRNVAHGGRRVVRRKTAFLIVLGGMLLALQYPIGSSHIPGAWGAGLTALLLWCAAMLIDALCERSDERQPAWANRPLGYVLPVGPRGFRQLATLAALLAAMALAMGIRGCAESSILVLE